MEPGDLVKKKLETDRRHIERRMEDIKKASCPNWLRRGVFRDQSEKSRGIPVVALVGYTNSGKSALMNRLLSVVDKSEKAVTEKTCFSPRWIPSSAVSSWTPITNLF